jgi:hypothetical protein
MPSNSFRTEVSHSDFDTHFIPLGNMGKKKWYVVTVGRNVGVFETW